MADQKPKNTGRIALFQERMPGHAAEGFKIITGTWIGGENLKRRPGRERAHGFFGFEDRKGAREALRIECQIGHENAKIRAVTGA